MVLASLLGPAVGTTPFLEYHELDLAFSQIKQINMLYTARATGRSTLHLTRMLDRNLIRSQDDLTIAVVAVQGAIKAVERQLYDLG